MKKFLVVFLIITILAFAAVKNRPPSTPPSPAPSPSPSSLSSQTSSEANVDVTVEPLALEIEKQPRFSVSFNTHSVDLNFTMEKTAKLTDEKQTDYGTAIWSGDPPGGHHRSGTLTFSKPIIAKGKVTLSLQNIAGVNRPFTWTID